MHRHAHPPQPPSKPAVGNITLNSVHLSWFHPGDATGVHFRIESSEGMYSEAWTPGMDVGGSTAIVSSLQPSIVYRFRVVAINEAGSAPSDPVRAQTFGLQASRCS